MTKLTSLAKISCVALVCFTAAILPQLSHADDDPWFTGPLLALPGDTVPGGHFNMEPYLFVTQNYGIYNNNWSTSSTPHTTIINPLFQLSYGINDWMDIQASLPYFFKNSQGQTVSDITDMNVQLGFQIYKAKAGSWLPDARLTVTEFFPTGTFDNLNPARSGLDGTGAGFYNTQIGINFQKVYKVISGHSLAVRWNLNYAMPYRATVHNYNVYGGGPGTNGTVHGANQFGTDLGLEYQLTRNWVPAIDIVYSATNPVTFTGNPGTTIGLPNVVGAAASQEVSLAPALEYDFNANLGVIGGIWFTVHGRNATQYKAGVLAVNYYI